MRQSDNKSTKKQTFKKVLLISLATLMLLIGVAGIFFYLNFNRLASKALRNSFEANVISDIYDLKFRNLRVNFFHRSIKVNDVVFQPRNESLRNYPYINSKIKFSSKQLLFSEVQIRMLLTQNKLQLEQIEINKPDLELTLAGKHPIFIPFRDSSAVVDTNAPAKKKHIENFSLANFDLIQASVHMVDSSKHRDLFLKNINISLRDLLLDQEHQQDKVQYSTLVFSIEELNGNLKGKDEKNFQLKDCGITLDSLVIVKTLDTLNYTFSDFNFYFRDMDMLTGDSLFQLTVESFNLSYANKLINIEDLSFSPTISKEQLLKKFKYQHNTGFVGKIAHLKVDNIAFDSLIYKNKLIIGEIYVDSLSALLFKDNTKPVDEKHLPVYLGQTVDSIPIPLQIGQVKVSNANLVSHEIKHDSIPAEAHVNRLTAVVTGISNLSPNVPLAINGEAWLEDKVAFKAYMEFNYHQPTFSYNASFGKFEFKDLDRLIEDYAPAKSGGGIVDKIELKGKATTTHADGTMTFLYHNLGIDIELEEKAKWKNAILSFVANTAVADSNPISENLPPKIVNYHVERDMNKGFVNVIIRSALSGLKETIFMSSENKKVYRNTKKKEKKEEKQNSNNS